MIKLLIYWFIGYNWNDLKKVEHYPSYRSPISYSNTGSRYSITSPSYFAPSDKVTTTPMKSYQRDYTDYYNYNRSPNRKYV